MWVNVNISFRRLLVLSPLPHNPELMTPRKTPFEKIVGKGENPDNRHFLPFTQHFLLFPKHPAGVAQW